MAPPLRAVILDNDETTGSYILLLSVMRALNKIGDVDYLLFTHILENLAIWMISKRVFRPGLIEFLTVLMNLKKEKKIDAIIMYTNQLETDKKLNYSLPRCISYMFSYLVPGFTFDHILTRPDDPTVLNNIFPKQFKRVLDLYPKRPLNIRRMLFFDDLAIPTYVRTDGIDPKYVSKKSYVLIDPYRVNLSSEDITECVKFCLEGIVDIDPFIILVNKCYSESSYKNSIPSIDLLNFSYFVDLLKIRYDSDGNKNRNRTPSRKPTDIEENKGTGN